MQARNWFAALITGVKPFRRPHHSIKHWRLRDKGCCGCRLLVTWRRLWIPTPLRVTTPSPDKGVSRPGRCAGRIRGAPLATTPGGPKQDGRRHRQSSSLTIESSGITRTFPVPRNPVALPAIGQPVPRTHLPLNTRYRKLAADSLPATANGGRLPPLCSVWSRNARKFIGALVGAAEFRRLADGAAMRSPDPGRAGFGPLPPAATFR